MSIEPYITIAGFVATNPRQLVTSGGTTMTTFRMAVTPRRFDRATGGWVDGNTQWYSIKSFREMAENIAMSIHKGDPVVAYGRLSVADWVTDEGVNRTSLEVDAAALGHDLAFGLAHFRRSVRRQSLDEDQVNGVDEELDVTSQEEGDDAGPAADYLGRAADDASSEAVVVQA